jgi:hypothetical protein
MSGQPLTISGWAVDPSAAFGSGIDAVVVSVDGPATTGASGVAAQYGTPRPDVAQQLGRPAWGNSGFTLTWAPQGLTPGPHTLVVSAHATRGVWSSSIVALAVRAGPPLAAPPAPGQVPPPLPAPAGPVAPRAPLPPPPCAISAYDTVLPICR